MTSFGRTVVLPKDLRCPVTNEPLLLTPDQDEHGRVFLYETPSGKKWTFLLWENVWQNPLNGDTYRWKNGWREQIKVYFESSFGSTASVNSKWEDVPSTNFGYLWIKVKNLFFTSAAGLKILGFYRKLFPKKLLFPMVKRVAAKTIANDLVSVQPMDGPKGTLIYLDYVYEKPSSIKISETNKDQHYTINKNNTLTSNGKEDQRQI